MNLLRKEETTTEKHSLENRDSCSREEFRADDITGKFEFDALSVLEWMQSKRDGGPEVSPFTIIRDAPAKADQQQEMKSSSRKRPSAGCPHSLNCVVLSVARNVESSAVQATPRYPIGKVMGIHPGGVAPLLKRIPKKSLAPITEKHGQDRNVLVITPVIRSVRSRQHYSQIG